MKVKYALKEESPGSPLDSFSGTDAPGEGLGLSKAYKHVDLVAVQGLASRYETTWTSHDEDGKSYMWLRDLLPLKLPHVRIQTFEYDSRWYGDPSHVSLRDCGKRLLRALLSDRTHEGQQRQCPTRRKRPLVLLGHSFGGLVINQAIVIAAQTTSESTDPGYDDCQDFIKSIAGIVYLGVPFRGSNLTKWAFRRLRLGKLTRNRSHMELLKVLTVDSTTSVLASLREDFGELRKLANLKDLQLFCFCETKETPLGMVVEKYSACLDGVQSDDMDTNHSQMNKLVPGEDFNKLSERLIAFATKAPIIVAQRYAVETYGHDNARPQYQRIASVLSPKLAAQAHVLEQLQSRRDHDTCHWTNRHRVLCEWRQFGSDHNVAWMYGIPGSGKSVLSAALVEALDNGADRDVECWASMADGVCSVETEKDKLPIVAYYFGGFEDDQHASWNVMSTIIHRCLLCHKNNSRLISRVSEMLESDGELHRRLASLESILQQIAIMTGGIRIVIDGFNELREWQSLIKSVSKICQNRKIRVLLAGHPNDQPEGMYLRSIKQAGMAFDIKDYTQDDIKIFIRKRVDAYRRNWPDNSALASDMETFLLQNGQGMYQWVSLVMDVIDRYGGSVNEARDALTDFPTGLQPMYFKVFGKIKERPQGIVTQVRESLRFLAVSLQPVTLRELYRYVQIQANGDAQLEYQPSDVEINIFREVLGSLVVAYPIRTHSIATMGATNDIQKRDDFIIELCHSSLQRLLVSEDCAPLNDHDAMLLKAFACSKPIAHRKAATICLKLAKVSFNWPVCYSYYSLRAERPELIEYAWEYWFSHLVAGECLEDDEIRQLIISLWDIILNGMIGYLGSLALSIVKNNINLGPDTGGTSKTAGLMNLEKSLQRSISALETLRNPHKVTDLWSHIRLCWGYEVCIKSPVLVWAKMRALLWSRLYNRHLSATAAEVAFRVTKRPELLPTIQTALAPTLDVIQSLQSLAIDLCMNPIRWQFFQYHKGFSPVVPLLVASYSLESIMLWPASRQFPIGSIGAWNVPDHSRDHKRLRYTVAELEKEPSEAEIRIRINQAPDFYQMAGSRILILGTFIELFQGEGTGGLLKAPFFNYWLNQNVHVSSSLTRGIKLASRPAVSFTKAFYPNLESKLPGFADAIVALPVQFILLMSKIIQEIAQRSEWYCWVALQWNYNRLRLAYVNYATIPRTLWIYKRRQIVPALLLYLIRWFYFPSFGQHWNHHAYAQIQLAIVAPLTWIESLGNWTWWDVVKYYTFYSIQASGLLLNLIPQKFYLLHECGSIYVAFWQILVLERTICQIVNATLAFSVPIALIIQPSQALPSNCTQRSFRKDLLDPWAEIGTTIFLQAGIRMAIPAVIIYYTSELTLMKALIKRFTIVVTSALTMVFLVLLLPLILEPIFRPTVVKDPAEVFMMSLLATSMVFYILHTTVQIQEDPWGLNNVRQGYATVVKKAERLTGVKMKTLQANVDDEYLARRNELRPDDSKNVEPSSQQPTPSNARGDGDQPERSS